MEKAKTILTIFLLIVVLTGLVFFSLGYFKPQGAGLLIESNPGASVYIDGQLKGRTPYEGTVEPGEISLTLVPDGTAGTLLPYETKINLNPGVKTVVRRDFSAVESEASGEIISFEKIPDEGAVLSIISSPDAAQIMVDGVVKGFTPIKISKITPGEHQLVISAPGYATKTFSIKTIEKYKLTVISKLAETFVPTPPPVLSMETQIKEVLISDTPTGYLNVRAEPSSASKEIGRVTPGLKYELVGEEAELGWYKIKYDGEKTGFISSKYATISDGDSAVEDPNNE